MQRTSIALAAIVIGLGIGLMILAANMLPTLYGDAHWFMPNAVNYAAGRGLINPWYPQADFGRGCRLVGHGYFPWLFYGTLMWSAAYRTLFFLTTCVAIAILAAAAILYHAAIPAIEGRRSWFLTACAGLMVAGLPPFLLLSGRPEALGMLIVTVAAVALWFVSERRQWFVVGVSLGLLAITSPAVGLLGAPLAAGYFCWRQPWRQALAFNAAALLLACVTVAVVSQTWYPFGLTEWVRGVVRHGSGVFRAPADENYLATLFLNAMAFAWGTWLLGGMACSALSLRRQLASAGFPAGVIVCSVILAAGVWRLALSMSGRLHYFFPFMPLACALVLREGNHWLSGARSRVQRLCAALLLLGIAAPPAVGTMRMLLMASVERGACLDYQTARRMVEDLRRKSGPITITSSLFPLIDDQEGVSMIHLYSPGFCRIRNTPAFAQSVPTEILVVQQTKFVWEAAGVATQAPRIPGFTLVADHFARHASRLWGVPLSSTPDAYNFAVYRKSNAGTAPAGNETRPVLRGH